MRIEFEPVAHTYKMDGVHVPSVTQVLQILEDFSGIAPHILEAARLFGSHVHDAVALDIRGRLDWANLDVALVRYVQGWRNFKADSGFVTLASEAVVGHRVHRYAGKLDLRGVLNKRRSLIDVKSGQLPRTVGPQTAAYNEGGHDTHGIKCERRYCLQLNPEFPRGYKLHALTDPADWNMFLSALNCWRFKYAS
jgi:hypothetical protein